MQAQKSFPQKLKSNSKLISFVLCFCIASAIWSINALNKEHQAKIVFTATINVPYSKNNESGKQEVITTVYIKGRGFDLARYLFTLDKKDRVLNFTSTNSDKIDLRASVVDLIKSQDKEITVDEVTPSFYALQGSLAYSKKVGIQLDYELTLPNLYIASDQATCSPDSLLISSENPIPDNITTVKMEFENYKSEGKSIEEVIKIKQYKNIFVEPTPITIHIPIEEATEKIIKIPVTCAQSNRQLKFIPSEITIQCKLPISKFDKKIGRAHV